MAGPSRTSGQDERPKLLAQLAPKLLRGVSEVALSPVLFELSLAINAKIDRIDEVFNLILTAAVDQQRVAETGSLFGYDEQANKLKMVRKKGAQESFIQYSEFDIGEGVAGLAAATRKSLLVNDCSVDPRYKPYTAINDQLRSILAVPIVTPGGAQLLGIICIHNSTSEKGFTPGDEVFVDGLARIAGVAWNNALTHSKLVTTSNFDSLTGLLNGEAIEEVANQATILAQLSGQPLSVLYIDLDNLKDLNDTLNTDVGDQAIIQVASIIKSNTYSGWRDKAGKWKEGDEFVVVLQGSTQEEAMGIGERIRHSVSERRLEGVEHDLPHVTVSVGIAELEGPGLTGHELVLQAEAAKTRAKKQGKNQVSN